MNYKAKLYDAKRLIDEGRPKDACGALRPVLEKHLKSLCAEKGISSEGKTIVGLIHALFDAKLINHLKKGVFLTWLNFGNAGSHAGDEDISLNDATFFLKGLVDEVGIDSKDNMASVEKKHDTRPKPIDPGTNNHRQALISAFYLSKFDHYKLGLGNQGQTFTIIANLLSIKVNTLKNNRDRFDPYTGSYRKGWWQAELSPQFADILQEYKDHDETVLRKMVLGFIKQ